MRPAPRAMHSAVRRAPLAARAGLAACLVALAGCAPAAPFARLAGPAPGALTAFDDGAARPQPFIVAGTTDRAARHLGTLDAADGADSVVVLIYGDNRPGYCMLTSSWGAPAVAAGRRGSPLAWAWAIVNIPVALVQAFVPTLDLFQDLDVSLRSHRPNGGGEQRVRRALEAAPADLIVSTGDIVQQGSRAGQWEDFVRRHAALRERTLYVAAVGNHERPETPLGAGNWSTAMGPPPAAGNRWYTVDLPHGLARFVILDSSVLTDPHEGYPDSLAAALTDAEFAWADSALAAPAHYRFLVLHHPLVSAGQHLTDWEDEGHEGSVGPRTRGRLLDLAYRHGVTAVFAGHEHLYLRAGVRAPDGRAFWHVTTGGGGSPLHHPSRAATRRALGETLDDGSRVTAARLAAVYHYVRLVARRAPPGGTASLTLEAHEVFGNGTTRRIDRFDLDTPVPDVPLTLE